LNRSAVTFALSDSEVARVEQTRDVLDRCLRAIAARGVQASAAEIARRTGVADGQVRKILKLERPLHPAFLRQLAELGGLSVSELFAELGWLPDTEVLSRMPLALASDTNAALEALEQIRPQLERLVRPAPSAPLVAAEAVLADPEGAERFEVRVSQIVSGGRYRTATNAIGEFQLQPGRRPLPYPEAAELAVAAGVREPPPSPAEVDAWPDFWSVRRELAARTHLALNTGQEYSWQGDPGHRTWRAAARAWPTHLLVQDSIAGSPWPQISEQYDRPDLGPIIMIGGRHDTGMAAAMLARALGRQFVLVREHMDVTRHGHVVALPVDARRDRTRAWMSVAQHVEDAALRGRPWRAVVLVRPAAFAGGGMELDPHATRLLRDTSARVLYVRTPVAYATWWAARMEGNFRPGERDGSAWVARTLAQYAQIEGVLAARDGFWDLLLQVPEPSGELVPQVPEVPAEVVDWTVRVAWTAAVKLGLPIRVRAESVTLRPGRLARWRDRLLGDPHAIVPALTDL
jgi:transcriptional regulator with XRE-family HTH domain